MGSYSHISFDGYPSFNIKNSYDREIVESIFLLEDYIVETKPNNSRNSIAWVIDENDTTNYTFRGFRQTAKICKKRLEIFGNNFTTAKRDFGNAKLIAKEEYLYQFSISKVTYKNYLEELKNII